MQVCYLGLLVLFHAKNNHVQLLDRINKAINKVRIKTSFSVKPSTCTFYTQRKNEGQNSSTGHVMSMP